MATSQEVTPSPWGVGGWGITPWGAGAEGGDQGPQILNYVPPIGTPIERTQPVQFDVIDDSGLFSLTEVKLRFADGSEELIELNGIISEGYAFGTSRVPIDCGFRYVVRREGGWIEDPVRVFITAVDLAGNPDQGNA